MKLSRGNFDYFWGIFKSPVCLLRSHPPSFSKRAKSDKPSLTVALAIETHSFKNKRFMSKKRVDQSHSD